MKTCKVFSILCAILLIYSCKKEAIKEPINITKTLTSEQLVIYNATEQVGILHNACLDYLYEYFIELKNNNWQTTEEGFDELLRTKIADFLELEGIEVIEGYEEMTFDENMGSYEFSTAANILIEQIETSIDSYEENGDLQQLQHAMNNIQIESMDLTGDEEKYIVGLTASVAKYSAYYWENDGIKYNAFYHELNDKASPGQIAALKADAKGALWGAVGGSTLGPEGTIFGGIFGAGYSSAVEGFRQKGYDCWFCP